MWQTTFMCGSCGAVQITEPFAEQIHTKESKKRNIIKDAHTHTQIAGPTAQGVLDPEHDPLFLIRVEDPPTPRGPFWLRMCRVKACRGSLGPPLASRVRPLAPLGPPWAPPGPPCPPPGPILTPPRFASVSHGPLDALCAFPRNPPGTPRCRFYNKKPVVF